LLKIGYKASAEQFGPSSLLEFACLAEQLNFDSVFVSDHFQPWRHTGGHAPYSFAWMGAIGARTNRIIIGTSVVTPTFRYHPSIVAQAVGTLGSMFQDRIILGVGTGESLNEVPATGIKWPGFKERFGRLRESIHLMNRLWREDRVSFEGQYYQTENATIYDRPEKPVPIYVAAAGPSAAALAGEVGAGFICTSGKSPTLYTETLLPKVSEGLATAKRSDGDIDRMIEIKVSFDTDAIRAKEDTKHWAALALSAEEKMGVEDALEMEKLADALTIDRAASRWIVSSDPDDVVEKVKVYVDLGFRHLVFHAPGPDQQRFLRLFAEFVMPKMRDAFSVRDGYKD
jgi:coenzyme F420-dependent glucose-6-phosphate dehydrogenase